MSRTNAQQHRIERAEPGWTYVHVRRTSRGDLILDDAGQPTIFASPVASFSIATETVRAQAAQRLTP